MEYVRSCHGTVNSKSFTIRRTQLLFLISIQLHVSLTAITRPRQDKIQIAVYSLYGVPQVCKNCYNTKLYKAVKTGCKEADGCKIINFLKIYTGVVKKVR